MRLEVDITSKTFRNAAGEQHDVIAVDLPTGGDADTGAIKRVWGAYGKPPTDEALPAYNAEKTISEVLARIPSGLGEEYHVEVLVLDDGRELPPGEVGDAAEALRLTAAAPPRPTPSGGDYE